MQSRDTLNIIQQIKPGASKGAKREFRFRSQLFIGSASNYFASPVPSSTLSACFRVRYFLQKSTAFGPSPVVCEVLTITESDSPTRQIVWTQLDEYLVPHQNLDVILSDLATNGGQDGCLRFRCVVDGTSKHCVGK